MSHYREFMVIWLRQAISNWCSSRSSVNKFIELRKGNSVAVRLKREEELLRRILINLNLKVTTSAEIHRFNDIGRAFWSGIGFHYTEVFVQLWKERTNWVLMKIFREFSFDEVKKLCISVRLMCHHKRKCFGVKKKIIEDFSKANIRASDKKTLIDWWDARCSTYLWWKFGLSLECHRRTTRISPSAN